MTTPVKFTLVLLAVTVLMVLTWDTFVMDRVYNCTDSVPFDYLSPGNWVHGVVQEVDTIEPGRSMPEPDTIKKGWTQVTLWALWFSMLGVSVAVSGWLATRPWGIQSPKGSPNKMNADYCRYRAKV